VRGAAHEEFVCEVGDELVDWDHLDVNVKVWYGSAPGKVRYNTEAFWLIDLQVTIIGWRCGAPYWGSVRDHGT